MEETLVWLLPLGCVADLVVGFGQWLVAVYVAVGKAAGLLSVAAGPVGLLLAIAVLQELLLVFVRGVRLLLVKAVGAFWQGRWWRCGVVLSFPSWVVWALVVEVVRRGHLVEAVEAVFWAWFEVLWALCLVVVAGSGSGRWGLGLWPGLVLEVACPEEEGPSWIPAGRFG